MYEKDFPQTNATIATLQVSQLVFSYLSIATRAFSIITYCHYCHARAKSGEFSAKKQRNTDCFRRKTLKKWRKRLAVSNIFLYFCNQQEKFLPIPPRSLRLL